MKRTLALCLLFAFTVEGFTYPIDGYLYSGIRRILRLQMILNGEIRDTAPIPGAQKSIADIKLNLADSLEGTNTLAFPEVDPELQRKLNALFPGLSESYSLTLMDISPGKPIRYAARKEGAGFQPGSVGKLAVATGLFCELDNIFPDSFEQRIELLKTRMVQGGKWAVYDEHTVPFFNPETKQLVKRTVNENDVFSLFEWADHMLSVSNNGAASVVWREAILMRVFGQEYLTLTKEEADAYFQNTPKAELSDIANAVVNEPLRELGITEEEWKLGLLFTRGASNIVPGKGGSIGTPRGLMKWLFALEQGQIVDAQSSLEIKRLMYMTDRRIRYASNAKLADAAVYFKSGSLYKCDRTTMPDCGKYMGNVTNYMNSVAIIEHDSTTVYLVALMSNVLKKNSATDHNILAGRIDQLVRE